MEGIQGLGGILLGFSFFRFFSIPGSKINKRLPSLKIHIIELFPRFKINFKNKALHIHHWILLSVVFVLLLTFTGFTQLLIFKSLCIGGIIQGFTFKDRFTIIHKITQS